MEKGNSLKRIVLTGPESTGKSQLCLKLAQHFDCPMIPELARDYLLLHGANYTESDVLKIAEMQIEAEEQVSSSKHDFLFIDTDLIITKVWLQHCYKRVPDWINQCIDNTPRHLHLLCYYDLPWIQDPLRENPSIRKELFEAYLNEIRFFGFRYSIIKGNGDTRFNNALKAISLL